jgi:hypothetical protein
MNTYSPARRNGLALCTLALLFSVFLWGLQYKTSLYHSGERAHPSIVPAKLLSEAERSSAQATISSILQAQPKVLVLFVVPSILDVGRITSEGYVRFESQQIFPPALRAWWRFLPRPPPVSGVNASLL